MKPALTTATAMTSALSVPQLSVETISDYQAFIGLEPVWNSLVERAGVDHPFLTFEWVRTWWECFGQGNELRILLVKAGDEPIAIAPLMLSRSRIYGLKVRRLESIYNDHTPRFDLIVAGRHSEVCRAIWKHIAELQGTWDVLALHQLPAGSKTLEELPRLAEADGFLVGSWRSGDSPYLPLAGSWEDYLRKLSRNHRSSLRNKLNRLGRLGQVELEVIASPGELEGALEEGLRIEAAAWKGKAGTAICCRSELKLFYTRLAERAAQRGWLRLHFLTVNGRRTAFDYSLYYKNKLYMLKLGYDPQYASYSPFKLLCYMILRDAFQRGIAERDFLGQDHRWKLDWTRKTKTHWWLFVFRNTLRTCLLHRVKFRVIPWLKRQRLYPAVRDALLALRDKSA